jgi:hypothetical protein
VTTIHVSTTYTNAADQTLTFSHEQAFTVGSIANNPAAVLSNYGTISVDDGSDHLFHAGIEAQDSLFWNETGATYSITGGEAVFGFSGIAYYRPSGLQNSGQISVTATAGSALGAYGEGNDLTLVNDGTITVNGTYQASGVELSLESTLNNSGTIHAEGGVQAIGIQINAYANETISNSGTISAHGPTAANSYAFYITNASGPVTIDNSGTLEGQIYVAGTDGGSIVLHNTGHITGDISLTDTADYFGRENDVIHNDGSIAGNVDLGWGNDTFDGTGTLSGTLSGGPGNDTLTGTAGNDTIYGDLATAGVSDGNDTITGGGGNDTLNGGGGTDTAVYDGFHTDYAVVSGGGVTTATDERAGSPDGTDTLTSIEQYQFADGVFVYNADGSATMTLTDADNSRPWSSQVQTFDAQGSLLTQTVYNDNGTHWVNSYDPGNGEAWSWKNDSFDTAGHVLAESGLNDDGTHWLKLNDVSHQYSWSTVTIGYDASWNQISLSGVNDDGSTTVSVADVATALDTTTWFATPYDANFAAPAMNTALGGGAENDILYGHAGDDTLYGGGGNDVLIGALGNDTLTGGAGNDRFVFKTGDGNDTVTDFAHGDVIDLHGYGIADFAALQPLMAQMGPDTVITFDAVDHITLQNVQMAQLAAGDFVFS